MKNAYRTTAALPKEAPFLYGTPGSIYVLQNDALRAGLYKIGITRRSGTAKAMELNRDLQHIIPGHYECVFEIHSKNCSLALEQLLQLFRHAKTGKRQNEFYQLDLDEFSARATDIVAQVNRQRLAAAPTLEMMRHLDTEASDVTTPANTNPRNPFTPPPSFLDKAVQWIAG